MKSSRRVGTWIKRLAVGTVVTLAGAALLLVLVIFSSLSGSPHPPAEALPELPEEYVVGQPRPGCGSGGCYLEADVTIPASRDVDEVVRELRDDVTDCRSNGLFDRRQLCTGIQTHPGGRVVVSVMLRDLWK